MHIEYAPTIPPDDPASGPLHALEGLLAQVLDRSADRSRATWERRADDRGRPLYRLSLRDPFGFEGAADFAPDELAPSYHLKGRLYDLWGDILQARSAEQLRRLQSEEG